jgi:hypothetical protein
MNNYSFKLTQAEHKLVYTVSVYSIQYPQLFLPLIYILAKKTALLFSLSWSRIKLTRFCKLLLAPKSTCEVFRGKAMIRRYHDNRIAMSR